jgi:hypothetical protein
MRRWRAKEAAVALDPNARLGPWIAAARQAPTEGVSKRETLELREAFRSDGHGGEDQGPDVGSPPPLVDSEG